MPLLVVLLVPTGVLALSVLGASLMFLGLLGWTAARAGGAKASVGALRVCFWGALAMGITYGIGALSGTVV